MIRESTKAKYAGMRFENFTVIGITRRDPKNTHHYFVDCKCDCGNDFEARISCIQAKSTTSCGCVGKRNRKIANTGNTYVRLGFGQNAKNNLYKNYIRYAVDRGLDFYLSFDEFICITEQNCFYCGTEPSFIKKPKDAHGHHIYNGVDRVDNSVGYSVDNCVAACRPCNSAKNAVTKEMVFKLYHFLYPNSVVLPASNTVSSQTGAD